MGAGLSILGVTTFIYLALAGRALGPEQFGIFAAFWMLLYTVGPGTFLPLEQELARTVSTQQAVAVGSRDVTRQAGIVALWMTLALVLLMTAAGPFVARQLLGGATGLLLALQAGVAAMAVSYLARGLLAGLQSWGHYGSQLALDGALRLLAVILLIGKGSEAPTSYAVPLVAALAISSAVTVFGPLRRLKRGPRTNWRDLAGALGWLLIGSLAGLFLLNAAPLAAQYLADAGERAAAGNFVAALVVARVPLFLFAAVQAVLLPALAGYVAVGRRGPFVRALFGLSFGVAALGILMVSLAALGGLELLKLVFGDAYRTDRLDLVLLTASTAGFMLTTVLSQALIALRGFGSAAAGPVVGVVIFVAGCVASDEPLSRRVSIALTVAVLGSGLVLGLLLLRQVRRWGLRDA